MVNLDPSLVNQDAIRKQRRKRLMTIYAAPVAVLLIIAGFFLSCSIFNLIYSFEYNSHSYDMAGGLSDTRLLFNAIEPYLAYYDRGVTELLEKQNVKAEESFNESLRHSPPKDRLCKIYVNLSLSIERQADMSLSGQDYEQALLLYNRAEATLYSNNCAGSSGSRGSDAKAETARDRINKKRNQAIADMNNSADAGDDSRETTDNQRRVTDEEVQSIIDQKQPLNDLRGITDDTASCSPWRGDKCY